MNGTGLYVSRCARGQVVGQSLSAIHRTLRSRCLFVSVVSPITWVLLFFCLLLACFAGWIYLRRQREARRVTERNSGDPLTGEDERGRGNAVDREVERVLNHAPVEWRKFGRGSSRVPAPTAVTRGAFSEATSSHVPFSSATFDAAASTSAPPVHRAQLRAPPNSAQVEMISPGSGASEDGQLAANNASVGTGVLLHQLVPETASHTVTPQPVGSDTSLRGSPHLVASPPAARKAGDSSSGHSRSPDGFSAAAVELSSTSSSASLVRVASVGEVRSLHSSTSPRRDFSPSGEAPRIDSSSANLALIGDLMQSPNTIADVAGERTNELHVGTQLGEEEDDVFRR